MGDPAVLKTAEAWFMIEIYDCLKLPKSTTHIATLSKKIKKKVQKQSCQRDSISASLTVLKPCTCNDVVWQTIFYFALLHSSFCVNIGINLLLTNCFKTLLLQIV